MSRTVDLVVVGLTPEARAAAVAAARAGRRVLVVDATADGPRRQRFRRSLAVENGAVRRRISVLTAVEVVCVAGTTRVEAILLRRAGSGRLIAVNAADLLVTSPPAAHGGA